MKKIWGLEGERRGGAKHGEFITGFPRCGVLKHRLELT